MFYNTGISTYIWIVSNRKPEPRKGKLQLIDASGYWQKMRKSLGSKRKELSPVHIDEITKLFGNFNGPIGLPIRRLLNSTGRSANISAARSRPPSGATASLQNWPSTSPRFNPACADSQPVTYFVCGRFTKPIGRTQLSRHC